MSAGVTSGISTSNCDYVRTFVAEQAGIVLDEGKGYLVESRLLPIARKRGVASTDELVSQLRLSGDPDLRLAIVEAMTTNETTFFRDVEPFEALKHSVIPDLIERRRSTRTLRIWCGASSTGQEPYSLMMLLREHFPELATWNISHTATDLSDEVLARARAGRFSRLEVNRGLPAAYLVKYFDKDATEWVIKPAIRNAVKFDRLNLIKTWPLRGPFDLVMLRNVMIYFDGTTKKQILDGVRRLLAPDAYLFLGSAETTIGIHDAFERQTWQRTGFYRLGGKAK
jgi:chemotaxis protein methyltransferase CheR